MFPNSHDVVPLAARPSLEPYQTHAQELVEACRAGGPETIRAWAARWPNHVDEIARFAHDTLQSRDCAEAAAKIVIGHIHGFEGWDALAHHLDGLANIESPIANFEAAVDAIVTGDATALQRLLRDHPALIRARSTRVHRSTLLHYTAANGVENDRQKTPPNIVAIAAILLDAGAEVDRGAEMYGGDCTTLGLAATSVWPERAGVQHALMQLLIDRGARIDAPRAAGRSDTLVAGCLANGRLAAAAFLAEHGGRVDVEGAAGIGRLDLLAGFFDVKGALKPPATGAQLRAGFLWACHYGHTAIVEFLLEHGVAADAAIEGDGKTGLHAAALGAHDAIVSILIERGADVHAVEKTFQGTPLSWALYGWSNAAAAARDPYDGVVARLVRAGARVNPSWLDDHGPHAELARTLRADARMLAALATENRRTLEP